MHYKQNENDLKRSKLVYSRLLVTCAVVWLHLLLGITAKAQTTTSTTTTTTLWAGTADAAADGTSFVTEPSPGAVLPGAAINSSTGKPFRHLWYGDPVTGLCRVDPDLEAPSTSVAGIANRNAAPLSCISRAQIPGFVPGQIAFDPSTNTVYAVNTGANAGVLRLHYHPDGDNGHGLIDPIHFEVLAGLHGTRTVASGCPMIGDPNIGGNPIPQEPITLALGPDGNLYEGFRRQGTVLRYLNPATFDPTTNDCQNKMAVPFVDPEEPTSSGASFGLAWVGHTAYGAGSISLYQVPSADQCLTPANGNKRCTPNTGSLILSSFVNAPAGGLVTGVSLGGSAAPSTLYTATHASVTRITNLSSLASMTLSPQFGGTYCLITGLTVDENDLGNEVLYIGTDCSAGATPGAGAIWQVQPAPAVPAPPAAPTAVVASNATLPGATISDGSATVSWTPHANGQLTSSYQVLTIAAADGTTVLGTTVVSAVPPSTLVPTTTKVTGLTLGVAIGFEVQACNDSGCSQASPISNAITPFVPTVPGPPANPTALATTGSAAVAWSAPLSDGGSSILSYTVTGFDVASPAAAVSSVTVGGTMSGANVAGLLSGHTYQFSVHATNAIGSGPESALTTPILIPFPTTADAAITVSAPVSLAQGPGGQIITYAITIRNNGPADIARATLGSAPSLAAGFSATTFAGCSDTLGATTFSCSLGPLPSGSSLTGTISVSVSSNVSGNLTGSFSVTSFNAAGAVLSDPVPANNQASATTNIAPFVAADLQLTGSAQNGGPTAPAQDTITWQIKNATGSQTVSGVLFSSNTASPNLKFISVSSPQGSCSLSSTSSLTCSALSLAGGQTMIVTLAVSISAPGNVVTSGTVSFNGTDTQPANNNSSVTIGAK
jgi:hypothetical protein